MYTFLCVIHTLFSLDMLCCKFPGEKLRSHITIDLVLDMQAELLHLKTKYGHHLHLKKAPPASSTAPFPIVVSWALDAPSAAEAYDISLVKVLPD